MVHCQSLNTKYSIINSPANGGWVFTGTREVPRRWSRCNSGQFYTCKASEKKKFWLTLNASLILMSLPSLSLKQTSSVDISKLAHLSCSYSACSSNFLISNYSFTVVYTLRLIILNLSTNWTALFPPVIRPVLACSKSFVIWLHYCSLIFFLSVFIPASQYWVVADYWHQQLKLNSSGPVCLVFNISKIDTFMFTSVCKAEPCS